ncbi:hypothetical protein VTK56DRAFT_257 [Thermocarpiscus australiensis]
MAELDGSGRAVGPTVIEGRSMAVLYGTETGNAEEIAVELGKMAERLHFRTRVDEMDSFKLADVLHPMLVIFVTSTTGQGDMPKDTLRFWKNLRREKLNNTNCLRSLRFAIFGLGDSSYLKFNWAARKLRARLLQLGASEFFKAGEADERHDNGYVTFVMCLCSLSLYRRPLGDVLSIPVTDIDSIYLPWYQELKATLLANYPLPESAGPIPDEVQLPPKYPLQLLSTMQADTRRDERAHSPSLTEVDRRFLASRTKSAARSHVDHPKSAAELEREDRQRRDVTFPAHIARQDNSWERSNRPVDTLDKDNILKDDPAKYLLERPPSRSQNLPPDDLLPIPNTVIGTLVRNDRVTPADHWQDVRHLTFHIPAETKDIDAVTLAGGNLTLTIWPKNYPEDVQELIDLMDWGAVADMAVSVKMRPRGLYFEDGATLRDLLIHNLDITAIPKRIFIKELVFFTDDEREKERLRELTMPGNEQEFYDYTCRPRRTILELLRDFPRVKIPFERVLDLFPVIRGRDFSVCNGGDSLTEMIDEDNVIRLEILAALVEYKTIIRKPRQGLCSRYLKHLPVGTQLRLGLKPSSGPLLVSHLEWAKRPLIAVATGTGIAAIRAVIQERRVYKQPGDTLLFFGCRNQAADFHFEHEWKDYNNLVVYPAFSRDNIAPDPATTGKLAISSDGNDGRPAPLDYDAGKNYVQHLIRKHADEVATLLLRKPIVCVCGNAGRMPVSVRNAFLDVLVTSGVVGDRERAEKWFNDPGNLTFWQETW